MSFLHTQLGHLARRSRLLPVSPSVPAAMQTSLWPEVHRSLSTKKGQSSKAPDKVEGAALEKGTSTLGHILDRQEENAKEGKHANESDSQPGYMDDPIDSKSAAQAETEQAGARPSVEEKSGEATVASEEESSVGTGSAEGQPIKPGSTSSVKLPDVE